LVVGDQEDADVWAGELVHPRRNVLQGIDVQSRVSLVHDRELGLEDGHLQDLVALLLPA
jgi:hypothetical protein